MKFSRPHRRPEEELERFMFQRLLEHVCHVRPEVPIPLNFLQWAIGCDLFIEDCPDVFAIIPLHTAEQTQVTYEFVLPDPITCDPGELFDITGPDVERATLTVSAQQRVQIQFLINDIKRSGRWVEHRIKEDSVLLLIIRVYHFILGKGDALGPDHLALLAAHGLYWLELSLEDADPGAPLSVLQISAALWTLATYEAIAVDELIPFLTPVFQCIDCADLAWADSTAFPTEFAATWGAAMANLHEPPLQLWVERLFAIAERLKELTSGDEREQAELALLLARLRAGL